jgi:hypothetical protein
MWLISPRTLPIIMLVVIPISISSLSVVLSPLTPFAIVSEDLGTPYSYVYIASALILVYAFYPIKLSYIKKRGFRELAEEYEYIKRILYLEIPILIVTTYIIVGLAVDPNTVGDSLLSVGESLGLGNYPVVSEEYSTGFLVESNGFFMHFFLYGLTINLAVSVTGGIIFMILVTRRKELGYYLAKSLFQVMSRESEDSKKALYLIRAIKLYDKFLRRTLNLEINNAKKIYSKILSDYKIDKNESINTIYQSFESSDKLNPVRCLSKIQNIQEADNFLIDESLGKKIKDLAIFFATIIPVAITLIQILLPKVGGE